MRAASTRALDARALATRAATRAGAGRGRRRDATATASVEKIPRRGATAARATTNRGDASDARTRDASADEGD